MQQYNRVKDQYSDTIVLCRVGDFYEAFGEDAETISRVLEIALTARDKNTSGTPIPMAGVPHHSLDSYLYKLVKEGHKVAIVEIQTGLDDGTQIEIIDGITGSDRVIGPLLHRLKAGQAVDVN